MNKALMNLLDYMNALLSIFEGSLRRRRGQSGEAFRIPGSAPYLPRYAAEPWEGYRREYEDTDLAAMPGMISFLACDEPAIPPVPTMATNDNEPPSRPWRRR
jgi:hypothetical protein